MKDTTRAYYVGLSVLRIWMCFEVILVHGWAHDNMVDKIYLGFSKFEGIAVPVFMLMSFLLTDMALLATQKKKIVARFKRLFIPHLFWAVAYWVIYKLLHIDAGFDSRGGLFWQVCTGISPLNATMWFQVDLIILTTIVLLIFRCLKQKDAIICITVIGFVALIMEYSGANGKLFANARYEIQYSIGRLCEMMPYVTTGVILCCYNTLDYYVKNKWHIIIASFFGICFVTRYPVFIKPEGYGYQGIYYIVMALLLICLFYYFPFHKLPDKICAIINEISKCTLGIYCIHRCVITILNAYVIPKTDIQANSFSECILVFILSLIISFIGSKAPMNWLKSAFV